MTNERANSAVSADDRWTVRRIIDWTTAHLKEHGSDSPRLDTEILLAHARGCERIELYTRFDDIVSDAQRAVMRDLVRRRAAAEPVAYLVGHREFFSLEFFVTSDVLIPRPDTETLVMEALQLVEPAGTARVLDVGTGSGCIVVALAVNRPQANLAAIDMSAAALSVASRNAEAHNVASRIRFLQGDLFAPLRENEKFELIVSNPPYVSDGEMETLPADVRLHEPHTALAAGADGLSALRPIINAAPTYLAGGGHLLLEISPEQAQPVCELLESQGEYKEIATVNDLADRVRVVRSRVGQTPRA